MSRSAGSRRKGGYSTPRPVIERLRSPKVLSGVEFGGVLVVAMVVVCC